MWKFIGLILFVLAVTICSGGCADRQAKNETVAKTDGQPKKTQDQPKIPVGKIANPNKEKNQDYFRILESIYNRHAMSGLVINWITEYNKTFKDFDAYKASRIVRDQADLQNESEQSLQVRLRQDFLINHKIDSKSWVGNFNTQFPGVDVIFDEIDVMVRDFTRDHIYKASSHLTDRHSAIAKEFPGNPNELTRRWNQYRMDYFHERAPKIVEQLKQKMKSLESIKSLQAKVNSN